VVIRRAPSVAIDPETGERKLKPVNENKLAQSQYVYNNALAQMAREYSDIKLFGAEQTKASSVRDPLLQMALEARDRYQATSDEEQGVYFKEMSRIILSASGNLAKSFEALLERHQKDRHHQARISLLKAKADWEFTEADVERMAEGDAT
jgi:hypothetical protein